MQDASVNRAISQHWGGYRYRHVAANFKACWLQWRIQWVGHVERMEEMAMPKGVLKRKLCAKRRIGRPRLRWTDDVTNDLRKMGIRGWTERARNRDQWRLIVKEAKAHPGL